MRHYYQRHIDPPIVQQLRNAYPIINHETHGCCISIPKTVFNPEWIRPITEESKYAVLAVEDNILIKPQHSWNLKDESITDNPQFCKPIATADPHIEPINPTWSKGEI